MTLREVVEMVVRCGATGNGLVKVMWKYPDLFSHIRQKRGKRTTHDMVLMAEEMTRKMGVLPCVSWMQNNGYGGLVNTMRRRPELFGHIERTPRKGKTPEEWVPIAEKLAAEYRGVLPRSAWLQKSGYSSLARIIRIRPGLFAHIKQDKPIRLPEEWVQTAEILARKQGGVLPCVHWLQKNGYSGLDNAMRSHPKLFISIKQVNKSGKKPTEWVAIAETLVGGNGGVLPTRLQTTGYRGLYQAIRKRPELFAHIQGVL